ncbi:MAG: hypothetical protein ABMB14_16045, partial [Myxococcota bacterium]
MWLAEWLVTALAASDGTPTCAPLDEPELRSYVLDAQSAIDRGDVELPAAILSELDARLPCLTFAPAPRMWADVLMARAIVEFSRGGDWEDPLAGALRIRPGIDRGVGAGHPLFKWEPPPPPAGGPPVPDGVRLYVDGFPSPTVPPSEGLYLVQKTDGRYWNTRLVHDGALPEDWLAAPVDQPARIRAWGRLGLVGGAGMVDQRTSWGSDVYPDAAASAGRFGVTGDLQVTFFSPFGLLARGMVTYGSAPWVDGSVCAIWAGGGLTVGAGASAVSSSVFEAQYDGEQPTRVERVVRTNLPVGTVLY